MSAETEGPDDYAGPPPLYGDLMASVALWREKVASAVAPDYKAWLTARADRLYALAQNLPPTAPEAQEPTR